MLDKIAEIVKEKDLVVPNILFFNYKKINLTESELVFLIYIINSSLDFNLKKIALQLGVNNKEVLSIIDSLTSKDLLEIKVKKDDPNGLEVIDLSKLYQKLAFALINKEEKKEDSNNLFVIFEKEFGRTLSPMEYELINAFRDANFSDEIIKSALKEATYNGVTNLRYIDKILHEWKKQGINTLKDLENHKKSFSERKPKANIEVVDYDWLNENE